MIEVTRKEKDNSPVGVIFLHHAANGEIFDSSQIDPEETFTVEDYPLYWFGEADNEESFNFLTEEFEKSENSIQHEFIFLISSHVHSQAVEFLHKVALGMYPSKTRKQSIFWLGQKASEESVKALKAVVDDTNEETKVKESAVFAISQLPKDRSVEMLIKIARTNDNPKVRKNAIFWLGQKDDKAALEFFKEILLKKK